MEPERLYIIDPTNFKGSVVNTMSAPPGATPTHVDYMGKPTTFEEYKKEKGNENLIALTWEDFERDYYKPYLDGLQKPFKEITEENWNEMLEVLPPQRWTKIDGGSFFFIEEATTANLHDCFVAYKGKHYSALRPIRIKTEELITQIQEQCQ